MTKEKRAIFVASGKGGIAKSVVCRIVGEAKRKKQITSLYDGDGTVGQLLQYLGQRDESGKLKPLQDPAIGVKTFALHSPGDERAIRTARDTLLDEVGSAQNDVLIDLPAGSLAALSLLPGLGKALLSRDFTPVLVIPISPFKASRRSIADALNIEGFKTICVRSGFFGDDRDYRIWNKSLLRIKFQKTGGIEITIPKLPTWLMVDMDEDDLSFGEAMAKLEIMDAEDVRAWWFRTMEALRPAAELLGL